MPTELTFAEFMRVHAFCIVAVSMSLMERKGHLPLQGIMQTHQGATQQCQTHQDISHHYGFIIDWRQHVDMVYIAKCHGKRSRYMYLQALLHWNRIWNICKTCGQLGAGKSKCQSCADAGSPIKCKSHNSAKDISFSSCTDVSEIAHSMRWTYWQLARKLQYLQGASASDLNRTSASRERNWLQPYEHFSNTPCVTDSKSWYS